jgi:hypothetical protein
MSLFDEASLIVTPNAFKASKLYSIKPTSGAGDLDVVRATTATRVNSAGLIEDTPYNLLQRSEQISTSPWTLTRSTVNTNAINSPIGTLTADELISNITGSNGSWTRQTISVINGSFNFSTYAKQGTSAFLQVLLDGLGGVIFDLSNGTIKLSSAGIVGVITADVNGWYKCSISGTATGQTNVLFIVGNSSMNLLTWFSTNGDSVYLWGAQLVIGSSAREYFPTTDRLNVPRLDYTNSTCPSILVEPQRTNLALRSEEFDNAAWSRIALESIVSNTEISPNGTLTAEKIIPNTTNTNHYVQINATVVIGQAYTFSFFAKKGEYNFTSSFISGLGITANWDLQNGIASAGASIVDFGNGWYRCIVSGVAISTTASLRIYAQNSTLSVLAGDGTSGIFIWGAQLEAGSNATSYIPTVASTVTRNQDVISKTGISSLIGQTEGTVFVEFFYKNNFTELLNIQNTTSSFLMRTRIGQVGTNILSTIYANGGSFPLHPNYTLTPNSINKICIVYNYANKTTKLFANGVFVGSTVGTNAYPTTSQDRIGLGNFAGDSTESRFNIVNVFKTQLSDAECIQLTTL